MCLDLVECVWFLGIPLLCRARDLGGAARRADGVL